MVRLSFGYVPELFCNIEVRTNCFSYHDEDVSEDECFGSENSQVRFWRCGTQAGLVNKHGRRLLLWVMNEGL